MKSGRSARTRSRSPSRRDEFDSPWKDLLAGYFPQFMAFFFPRAAAQIDWSREFEFLDKEFRKVVRDADIGQRRVDSLVRVYEKSGAEAWVLVHVEIQSSRDAKLEHRMFVYHYRIYDRYQRPISSLAVLADTDSEWRPSEFGYELWGCGLRFWFPVSKILDFADRFFPPAKGSKSPDKRNMPGTAAIDLANPFAVAVKAHLRAKATRNDMPQRLIDKWSIVRSLYQAGYDKATILDLFRFIDWVMALPPELEEQFDTTLQTWEEKKRMPYISSFERRAEQRGLQRGQKKGEEIGEKRGEKRGEMRAEKQAQERLHAIIRRMLARGDSPQIVADITGVSLATVKSQARAMGHMKEEAAPYTADAPATAPTKSASTSASPAATKRAPAARAAAGTEAKRTAKTTTAAKTAKPTSTAKKARTPRTPKTAAKQTDR